MHTSAFAPTYICATDASWPCPTHCDIPLIHSATTDAFAATGAFATTGALWPGPTHCDIPLTLAATTDAAWHCPTRRPYSCRHYGRRVALPYSLPLLMLPLLTLLPRLVLLPLLTLRGTALLTVTFPLFLLLLTLLPLLVLLPLLTLCGPALLAVTFPLLLLPLLTPLGTTLLAALTPAATIDALICST
jgi:hypothetical protein